MKKRLVIIGALIASCIMLFGCGGSGDKPSSEAVKLAAPTELKMNSKGELTWDEVESATAYEIVIGDQVTTVNKTKQDLFDVITSAGDYTVSVSAVGGESATYEFKAVQLAAPSTPVIAEDPETHAVKFVWKGGENTRAYLQEINGSGKWVSNAENYFEITSAGTYTISVKAKGYAAKDVLYLESAASAASETYEHKPGPVLQLTDMAVIDWTVEDGVEFDSFNLWINGVKVKENIQRTEEGYALTGGENPAITKTGEYNVQLEAIDGDNSYWSNMLVEIGTYNINQGEIYSFDNRIAKFPVLKDGVTVSNEQYHGENGHSLRYEATKSEQINLVKYAEGTANDIDFRTIRTISYWVYIEPIAGVEGNFPADDLPAVKWEKEWGDGTWKSSYFATTEDVPFGEWTKVTIENINNAYDNVLILRYAKTLEQDYVIYIDDITYEALWEDVTKEDADYEVEFSAYANNMGSWITFDSVEIDFGVENANTTLTVTMDVCGTAPTNIPDGKFGLFNDVVKNAEPVDFEYIWIDVDKISTLDQWSTITVKVKTDANGKTYLAGAYDHGGGKILPFSIFIKNVQVGSADVDGEAAPNGTCKTEVADGYYQTFVGLATDCAVGTLVKVEMDVYVTGEFNEYTHISWVDTVYTVEGGEIKDSHTVLAGAAISDNLGNWVHVSFDAIVREFDVLRMDTAYPMVDVSATEKGVYLVGANFKSENSFHYKNVTVTEKMEGIKAVPTGTEKLNSNGFYQAFVGLPTDLEVGTMVTVSMDIMITGAYNEYTDGILWVDTVYTTEGGEVNSAPTIVSVATMNENGANWIHVEFEATVRNFNVLRMDTGYSTMDVSAYGNAVYLMAKNFTSAESFNYKNVTMTKIKAVPAGAEKTNPNGFYQAFVGLSTELEVGTTVTVSMDIMITGTYNEYTDGILWVDTVYTTEGGEVNSAPTIVSVATMNENGEKWIHVEFEATVRNFNVLRMDTGYSTMDVSAYGNAVYIMAKNFTSAESFHYKNVVITAN